MSSKNPEDFEQFHFPATNCFSNKRWRGALILWYPLVRRISGVSLNDRAVQTNCSETCYISSKSWDFPLFRKFKLVVIEMSSENLQKNEINTFQRSIPEINRSKFMKYYLISRYDERKISDNVQILLKKYYFWLSICWNLLMLILAFENICDQIFLSHSGFFPRFFSFYLVCLTTP